MRMRLGIGQRYEYDGEDCPFSFPTDLVLSLFTLRLGVLLVVMLRLGLVSRFEEGIPISGFRLVWTVEALRGLRLGGRDGKGKGWKLERDENWVGMGGGLAISVFGGS